MAFHCFEMSKTCSLNPNNEKMNDAAAINNYKTSSKCGLYSNLICLIEISNKNISIYCDDLMSIVKAFAIYVRENSSRMSCNAKKFINFRN